MYWVLWYSCLNFLNFSKNGRDNFYSRCCHKQFRNGIPLFVMRTVFYMYWAHEEYKQVVLLENILKTKTFFYIFHQNSLKLLKC